MILKIWEQRLADSLEPRKCCLVSSDNFISLKVWIRALEPCLHEIKEDGTLSFLSENIDILTKQFIIILKSESESQREECLYFITSVISRVCLQTGCITSQRDGEIKCCTKLGQFNFSERPRGPNRRHKLPVGNTPLSPSSNNLNGIAKFIWEIWNLNQSL